MRSSFPSTAFQTRNPRRRTTRKRRGRTLMARHLVHPWPWADNGPQFYPAWREEFNSRASWGRHPTATPYGPNRDKHDGEYGPADKQGFHKEHHPGDDYE